jgi:lipopolysaccharide heptosyltransferase II
MTSSASGEIRRVLLTRLKFIGDVVLTTPAVESVRAALPGAEIVYLAEREASSLLAHHPGVDEVIGFDFSRPAPAETARVVRVLRRHRFDLAVDFFSNPRSALLTYLSGARVRVGLDRGARRRLYTIRVRDDGRPKTAPEFHQQLLSVLGIPSAGRPPVLVVSGEERGRARRKIEELTGIGLQGGRPPVVVLHAGGTWPAKLWMAERFAALADRASQWLSASVLLSEGPGDGATIREVLARAHSAPRATGVLPLRELAALLAESTAVVSNDAGPMHIAAAVGTPTVGLFGPGQEEIWFPYERSLGHRALRRDVACHPCHLNICNRPGSDYMECMQRLEVEEVFEALREAVMARTR